MGVAELETYLTLQEFATHARVTVNTVRSWMKRGQAPKVTKFAGTASKVLFAVSDVAEWERERRGVAS